MRIEYIDHIKGFAILLVVMGHLIDKSLLLESSFINKIIYTVHMPLFMYLSGLFAYKHIINNLNIKSIFEFVQKKTTRLILPYITIGGLYAFFKSENLNQLFIYLNGYWFFPTLFMCMIYGLILINISTLFTKKVHEKYACYIDCLLFIITWGLTIISYYKGYTYSIPYFLSFIKMVPFFSLGYFTTRYEAIQKIVNSNKSFTIALIIYFALLCINIKINFKIEGLFAIIIVQQLFKKFYLKCPKALSYIGKNSLEIYSIHWFLLPNLMLMRNLFENTENNIILNNQNLILLICLTSIIAVLICYTCIGIANIIKNSNLLSAIIFGNTKSLTKETNNN